MSERSVMSVGGLGRAASSAWALLACLAALAVLGGPAHGADTTPPHTGITAPGSAFVKSLPTVSGTATDTGGSLLAGVQVRIQELTTFTYWNSATGLFDMFLAPPSAWFNADPVDGAFNSNSEVWSSTGLAVAIASIEGPYKLEAQAVDGAGNVDLTPPSLNFTIDLTPPVSSVALPIHGTSRLTLTDISGGAADFVTAVATVQVRVQDMTTGSYWDGATGFAATEHWSTATVAGPFWLQPLTASLVYGRTYQVVSKAFDLAGNAQSAFTVGIDSVSFLYDNSPPSTAGVTGLTAGSASAAWALIYGSTGYNLVASLSPANPPAVAVASATSAEFETSAALSGLTPNTTYSFFVRAQGPNAATLYTLFATSATLANAPASAVSSGVTSASVGLAWSANSNPAGTVYAAEAASNAGFSSLAASSSTVGTSASLTGLGANATYYLRVKAISHGGIATAYAAAGSTITDASVPSSPAAQANSGTQVTLTWGANGNPAGTSYTAQVSTDSGFGAVLASSTTLMTSASFSALGGGTTYYLRVKAVGFNGSATAYSASASTVTPVTAPSDAISGTVKTSGGVPINLVEVDLYDASNARVGAPAFTDAAGAWNFAGLTPGAAYRVAATWTLSGVSSQIFQDGHHPGESGVPLTVELNVTLGSFFGTLHLAGTGTADAHAATRTAASASFVDIYQNGVKVGSVPTDAHGGFVVSNLLPGNYVLRPFDGISYGVMTNVSVAPGQAAKVSFASTTEFLPPNLVYFYPNPARDHAVIRFESAATSLTAEASIYDLAGGLVRVLTDGEATRSAGETSWNWNLTDSHGAGVASGVYFVRVKVVDASSGRRTAVTKKLAVVR